VVGTGAVVNATLRLSNCQTWYQDTLSLLYCLTWHQVHLSWCNQAAFIWLLIRGRPGVWLISRPFVISEISRNSILFTKSWWEWGCWIEWP